jgi:hypothetical protein
MRVFEQEPGTRSPDIVARFAEGLMMCRRDTADETPEAGR